MPRYTIIKVEEHPERKFSLDQAAELCGLHPEMILEFVRAELVQVAGPQHGTPPRFDQTAIIRLRHIATLRHEHVSLRTVRYIIHLLDRLDATDRELHNLRERLR